MKCVKISHSLSLSKFPGEREVMDVSGRGCSCSGSCVTRDDVHELHVGFQPDTATASLQRVWKGKRSVTCTWSVKRSVSSLLCQGRVLFII